MKFLLNILLTLLFLTYSNSSFGADWFGYVANNENNTVVPINLSTNVPGTPISTGGSAPTNIAITPDGLTAYVVNNLSNDVTTINLTNNSIETLIAVGSTPVVVAITHNGVSAYVTNNGSHNLTMIDIATNIATTAIDFGVNNNPFGIAITQDGTTAYIVIQDGLNSLANSVVRFDIESNTLVGSPIPVPNAYNIAITPDGLKAYVTTFVDNSVVPIDITTNLPLTPIPVGLFPFDIAITSTGTTAFVTNQGDSTVTPINIATDTAGTPITVGCTPYGIAITPDSQTVYVCNFGTDDVTPIPTSTDIPGINIPMTSGGAPYGIAITPDQAPIASFTALPSPVGSPTFFDASASTTLVGTIVLYEWDFGDGNIAAVTTPTFNYTYSTSGTFLVTLTVTNSAGTSAVQTFTGKTISNNGGPSAITSQQVTILSTTPTVTNVSPNFGPVTGGNSVTITGTNFINVTAVNFGTTSALSFIVNSPTSITAIAPASAAGIVDITITTAAGTSPTTVNDRYTYQNPVVAPPAVTNVTANVGPLAGGNSVTITGTNFINVIAVNFGSAPSLTFIVNSSTSITATAPPGAAGTVNITITTLAGTSAAAASNQYTYQNSTAPLPPSNFIGAIQKNKFLNKTEYVLKAKWDASPSTNVVFYRIYKKGKVVEEIPATSRLVFKAQLHNGSGKGFFIAAVSSDNLESSHLKIRIVHE